MKINEQTIKQACDELAQLLIKKNNDYGNSVEEQFKEYGLTSGLIRLDDKMRRLKNLKDKTHHEVNETLKDTAQDLSGYSVLLSILLSSQPQKMLTIPELTTEEFLKIKYHDQDHQY